MELSQLSIREVDPEGDATAITLIYNHFILETDISFETEPLTVDEMKQRIAGVAPRYPYIVVETEGRIVGYAYVHEWSTRPAYAATVESSIYLSPEIAGQGIGGELLGELETRCKERGIEVVLALITATNKASCRFHEHAGYEKVGHLSGVGHKFGRTLDVAIYEHKLPLQN